MKQPTPPYDNKNNFTADQPFNRKPWNCRSSANNVSPRTILPSPNLRRQSKLPPSLHILTAIETITASMAPSSSSMTSEKPLFATFAIIPRTLLQASRYCPKIHLRRGRKSDEEIDKTFQAESHHGTILQDEWWFLTMTLKSVIAVDGGRLRYSCDQFQGRRRTLTSSRTNAHIFQSKKNDVRGKKIIRVTERVPSINELVWTSHATNLSLCCLNAKMG